MVEALCRDWNRRSSPSSRSASTRCFRSFLGVSRPRADRTSAGDRGVSPWSQYDASSSSAGAGPAGSVGRAVRRPKRGARHPPRRPAKSELGGTGPVRGVRPARRGARITIFPFPRRDPRGRSTSLPRPSFGRPRRWRDIAPGADGDSRSPSAGRRSPGARSTRAPRAAEAEGAGSRSCAAPRPACRVCKRMRWCSSPGGAEVRARVVVGADGPISTVAPWSVGFSVPGKCTRMIDYGDRRIGVSSPMRSTCSSAPSPLAWYALDDPARDTTPERRGRRRRLPRRDATLSSSLDRFVADEGWRPRPSNGPAGGCPWDHLPSRPVVGPRPLSRGTRRTS